MASHSGPLSSFHSPAPHWGHPHQAAEGPTTTNNSGLYPPGPIQVPPFPSFDHHDEDRQWQHQHQHQQRQRSPPSSPSRRRARNPFVSPVPPSSSPSPPRTQQRSQQQSLSPPLTIVARVRAFLGPPSEPPQPPQQRGDKTPRQRRKSGEAAAAAATAAGAMGPAYVSVVARDRLVVVDPGALGGGGQPDVVIGLAAAVNRCVFVLYGGA